jgi:hypothetical protein
MNKHIQWLVIICSSVAMLGCTVMQPLTADPRQLSSALSRGDQVEVTTTSSQQLRFAIESIDEQGLHGGGQNVAYSDIRSISRRQSSTGRTTLLVLGIVAAGAALAAGGGGGGGGSSY